MGSISCGPRRPIRVTYYGTGSLPKMKLTTDQGKQFSGSIAPRPDYAPWNAANTLVSVWMGVNDVGNSWWLENYTELVGKIMDSYFGQLQLVYDAGARNFVLLSVPREFNPHYRRGLSKRIKANQEN